MKTILSIVALILAVIIIILMLLLKILSNKEETTSRNKTARNMMIGITICSVLIFIIQIVTLFLT